MVNSRATIFITLALLVYFLWMDVALFYQVHTRTSPRLIADNKGVTMTTSNTPHLMSPFAGLSVKMMMMDQVNNYIHTPAADVFNEMTHFSTVFYFITPNMVSFAGLLFAVGAAKCMTMESRGFHYLALVLFQVRTYMDALDGIVARSRLGMVQHVSLRNTSGYVVDAVADTIGFFAFLVGCFQFLRKAIPKQRLYLPLTTSEKETKNGPCSSPAPLQPIAMSSCSQKRVFIVVLSFGLQLALSAFFWDHYINAYHNLLETQPSSQSQADAQNEVLRSSITWVLMWFWRISNAHTLMQMLLYAIFINRLWEFLVWIQYIGFVQILILSFFTEIHISTVRNFIIRSA